MQILVYSGFFNLKFGISKITLDFKNKFKYGNNTS